MDLPSCLGEVEHRYSHAPSLLGLCGGSAVFCGILANNISSAWDMLATWLRNKVLSSLTFLRHAASSTAPTPTAPVWEAVVSVAVLFGLFVDVIPFLTWDLVKMLDLGQVFLVLDFIFNYISKNTTIISPSPVESPNYVRAEKIISPRHNQVERILKLMRIYELWSGFGENTNLFMEYKIKNKTLQ